MRLWYACGRGNNSEVEQCLSDKADVYYERGVSSDYYCTDEDDHFIMLL